MERVVEYILDVMFKNLKDNIKVYCENSDKYFLELKNLAEIIIEDETYLKFFIEYQDALMLVTNSTLSDLKKIPYIYDFRDGI